MAVAAGSVVNQISVSSPLPDRLSSLPSTGQIANIPRMNPLEPFHGGVRSPAVGRKFVVDSTDRGELPAVAAPAPSSRRLLSLASGQAHAADDRRCPITTGRWQSDPRERFARGAGQLRRISGAGQHAELGSAAQIR